MEKQSVTIQVILMVKTKNNLDIIHPRTNNISFALHVNKIVIICPESGGQLRLGIIRNQKKKVLTAQTVLLIQKIPCGK